MNSIALVGRAGRDPEVKYFESGSCVANLTLAVNRPVRDEEPDWFNLEIWGKQAQVAADYVKKGSLIGITGSMQFQRWTTTTGEERSKPVVRVDRLQLLGSKRDSSGDAAPQADPPAAAPRPRATAPAAPPAWDGSGGVAGDDDIPF